MQLRQSSLVFLTTTLLVALTGQWANAISLDNNGTQGYEATFNLEGGGKLIEHGDNISLLSPPDEKSDFMQTLTRLFPSSEGWTFTPAKFNLPPGQFKVDYFLPDMQPGRDDKTGKPTVNAGANIQLRYIPPLSVPLPGSIPDPNKLHWIQRVTAYDLTDLTKIKGDPNNFIDVPSTQNNPFYDLNPGVKLPNKYTFQDMPGKTRFQANSTTIVDTFVAELFLVSGPDPVLVPDPLKVPKLFTIYNGISWSWKNTFTPPPSGGGGGGCSGGSGGGGCTTVAFAARTIDRELPLSDIDSDEASQSPKSVPEPTTALGVLVLGAWGVVQGLKKRIAKQP